MAQHPAHGDAGTGCQAAKDGEAFAMATHRVVSLMFALPDLGVTNRPRLVGSMRGLAMPLGSLLMMLLSAAPAMAQSLAKSVTLVPNATGDGITSFSGTVNGLGGVSVPLAVKFRSSPDGVATQTITVNTNGSGGFTVNVPRPYQGLYNQAEITYFDSASGQTYEFPKVIWYDSAWIWGTTPAIKVDPTGYPGGVATGGPSVQDWFIQSSTPLDGSAGGDPGAHSVVASSFDVSYAEVGSSTTYDMTISGDSSYIRLDDGTEIDLPNGDLFGTIEIPAGCTAATELSSASCQTGLADFPGIGVSGTWDYDSASNYTDFTAGGFSSFGSDDPAISEVSVPEPASLAVLGCGLLALGAVGRRRR
jgi:PEP-CTERM motif